MSTKRLLIASMFALGAGAALQGGQARELPDSIRAFALEQQQAIKAQGESVSDRIRREVWKEYESTRLAFIERQERAMRAQGSVAIAAIKSDLDLIRFEGALARLMPRPERRGHPEPPIVIIDGYYDR